MEGYFIVHAQLHHEPGQAVATDTHCKQSIAGRLEALVDAAIDASHLGPQACERLVTRHEHTVLRVEDGARATALAQAVLGATPREGTEAPPLRLQIGVEQGSPEGVLATANDAEVLAGHATPEEIVISAGVYDVLPLDEKDRYGAAERVDGITFRRRFRLGMERCFVISPIGNEDSSLRDRADLVFDRYIKPSCASQDLQPVRSDQEFSAAIRGDLMSSLADSPMVVAYLGRPPWNPNVMIEVGYRLATRKPIVFIRDAQAGNGDADPPDDLPFDLTDHQVLSVPIANGEANGDEKTRFASRVASALREGKLRAKAQEDEEQLESQWVCMHSVATIDVGLIASERSPGREIVEASAEAAKLLGHPEGVVHMEIDTVIGEIGKLMPRHQFNAFAAEQEKLFGQLLNAATTVAASEVRETFARVPMYFDRHPDDDFNHKAILPVIVRYRNWQGVLRLLILYLDVTAVTHVDCEGVFRCNLFERESGAGLLWDLYARSYDRVLPQLSFYREVVGRHVEAIAAANAETVLEIGSGTGNVTIPLLERGLSVVAVDNSRAMVGEARRKLLAMNDPSVRCLLFESNAECLAEIGDRRFDAVSILLALFAMERPHDALDEATRLLAPGGTMVITEPKDCFEIEPIIEQARLELETQGRLRKLEEDWERVTQVNRDIDPARRTNRITAERVAGILEARNWEVSAPQDSHFGNCATVIARKPPE